MNQPELGYQPTMPVVLRRAAELFGDHPCIITDEEVTTFADLEGRSRRLARRLLAAGVGKGTRVGMHIPVGNDWVIAFAATTRIGALVMPFSTLYAPAELGRALRIGDIQLLLAPSVMFGRDHAEFLERAVPGLASTDSDSLRIPEVPFLRSILLLDGSAPGWATTAEIDPSDSSAWVSEEMLGRGRARSPADEMVVIVLEAQPDIALAFVMGVPHAERGEQVAAVLVPAGPSPPDIDDLCRRLAAELSSYKVPRRFVVLRRRGRAVACEREARSSGDSPSCSLGRATRRDGATDRSARSLGRGRLPLRCRRGPSCSSYAWELSAARRASRLAWSASMRSSTFPGSSITGSSIVVPFALARDRARGVACFPRIRRGSASDPSLCSSESTILPAICFSRPLMVGRRAGMPSTSDCGTTSSAKRIVDMARPLPYGRSAARYCFSRMTTLPMPTRCRSS